MGFQKIRDAELETGRLIRHVLEDLPGKPAVWLEFLGPGNRTWINAQLVKVNPKDDAKAKAKDKAAKDKSGKPDPEAAPLTYEKWMENRAENVAQARATISAHAVRRIEAKHDDGRDATDEDIPEFCDALPSKEVFEIHAMCLWEPMRWRDPIEASAKDVAEK